MAMHSFFRRGTNLQSGVSDIQCRLSEPRPHVEPDNVHWTYEDYVRHGRGESFESIDGERFVNPQPTVWHQMASRNLARRLLRYLERQNVGELLHPPVDVIFADDTVLQPDIAVVLEEHRSRIQKAGLFGAPDFIVEFLSPSTASRDRREKRAVYARHGVREYWLADPERQRIEIFVLESGSLVKKAEHDHGEARSLAVLPGLCYRRRWPRSVRRQAFERPTQPLAAIPAQHLGDPREVMVVVLRDEERLVDDPHRHLEARMEAGADDLLLAELLEHGHVLRALGAEALEDLRDRALVVTRLVRLPVREVRARSGRRRRRASPRGGRARAVRGRAGAQRSAAGSISLLPGRASARRA